MIKKVDISQFGSFRNFSWNTMREFQQRNIIYGRNYSGKTTLSRVFQCLEKNRMHEDFKTGNFLFNFESGDSFSESQLPGNKFNIRVYNSDFKRENLSVLHDDNGDVKPFAIIGESNIDIEKSIKINRENIVELEKEIGDSKKNEGLWGEYNRLKEQLGKLDRKLSQSLTEKAGEIRGNTHFFIRTQNSRTYDKRNFEAEIPLATKLSMEDKETYSLIIKDEPKGVIRSSPPGLRDFKKLKKQTEDLLAKEIRPSKSIGYLLENNTLQKWVEEGIQLHKHKRDTCAFCNNPISGELWEALDAHFTEEAEKYKNELLVLAQKIEAEIMNLRNYQLIHKDRFYSSFQNEYSQINDKWDKIKVLYESNLNVLYSSIKKQIDSLFTNVKIADDEVKDISIRYNEIFREYQNLIEKNNAYTQSLDEKQVNAREKLRLDYIHSALNDINYEDILNEMNELKAPIVEKKDQLDESKKIIEELKEHERALVAKLNDQEAAVSKVNYYLKSQLGHEELELLAMEKKTDDVEQLSSKKYQFQIMRHGDPAYNLSEGEQSLISFCYFLATLKDIENPEEWTIFIDDPISSLDGNNIFYIFSLIDSEIAQIKYKQIFISTHNLDLLKYLHRLEKPTNHKEKWAKEYFLIEKKINGSQIVEMPKYLKKYSTEFIYLFNEIYIVGCEEQSDKNLSSFYNFPNNARKFLESYLFFRFPDSTVGNNKRLQYFFNDVTSVSFLQRINNEFSHGEEQPDRLHKPIDVDEFKKDALIILEKIQEKDEDQFKSLCNSIGADVEVLPRELSSSNMAGMGVD